MCLWFNYIILMSCIRIGEARNPGPVIGTCNPSGMLGKAQMLAEMPEGIWGITETHLSCYGIQKFRQDFRFHQPKSRFLHGAPAPRLSNSPGVIGGKASGVALISSYPARNLQHCFEEDFASSRIHVGTCLVNNHWVKCGTFYGFACDAKTKTVKEKSDHLLTCLVERIGHRTKGHHGRFQPIFDGPSLLSHLVPIRFRRDPSLCTTSVGTSHCPYF